MLEKERRALRKLLSVLALLISLAYLYKNTDIEELALAVEKADCRYLLLSLTLSTLTVLISAFRWYLILKKVQKVSFKRTLQAFISGYYLMTVFPPSLGHMAKVKLVGGDYFAALSSLAIGMVAEIIVVLSLGLMLLGFTKLNLFGMALVVVALTLDRPLNNVALAFFRIWEGVGLERISRKLEEWWLRSYLSWRKAKESGVDFTVVVLISLISVTLQVFGLITVGKAFSLDIPLKRAFYAFIMSAVFSSLSGIPAGFGANEFGILVGIGASTKGTLTAFLYKFLFQYQYSIIGALIFYKLLGGSRESSAG